MYECNCNDIWLGENVNTCNIFISWRMMISKRKFFKKIFITRCKFFLDDKWNEIIRRDFEAGGAYIISVTVTNLWGNFLTRKRFEDTQVFCKVSTVIPIIRLIYNNILYASSPGKNSIESDIRKKKKKR